MPRESLINSDLDAVVLGEGEETAVALSRALEAGIPVDPITGIAYKSGGPLPVVNVNPRRARIADLDAIAWPAWDLMPIQAYMDRQLGFGVSRGRSGPMLASRGCPYRCTFCSNPEMWTTR